MKRSPLKKLGKIGKINKASNEKLKELFIENDITSCEICGLTYGLTFAHRHKRVWYRSRPELLSDANQVLLLCLECHQKIEYNKKLTEETFIRLRGEEVLVNG